MLLVREDAVEAAWTIVDPILGNDTMLHQYAPRSWGPQEADRLAIDVGAPVPRHSLPITSEMIRIRGQ